MNLLDVEETVDDRLVLSEDDRVVDVELLLVEDDRLVVELEAAALN